MNSNTPKGGIATPESLPSITQTPQTENAPAPVPYSPHQYPVRSTPPRYPPVHPRQPSGASVVAWIIGGIAAFVILVGLVVAMLAALIGGFAASTIGQRELSTTSSKTFTVSGTPSLMISDTAGNITIQQGDGNQVTVQVTKHAWGSSTGVAQDGLNRTTVDVMQSANTITVNVQVSGPERRSVDLSVMVPPQANADVHLAAGNIDVRQFTGAITLDAGAGNVTADTMTFAGTSRLHTGAGNITVAGAIASGATVAVLVGAGNATLTLPSDTPAHLTASSGIGNVTITGWQIPVSGGGFSGHSASGDLGADPTGMLTIQIGTGNLMLMSR